MPDLPQISEAEFEVMKIIWKYAPINTNEITERLLKTTRLESENDPDTDQAARNKRSSDLRKTGPGFCLYSPGRAERICKPGKLCLFKPVL